MVFFLISLMLNRDESIQIVKTLIAKMLLIKQLDKLYFQATIFLTEINVLLLLYDNHPDNLAFLSICGVFVGISALLYFSSLVGLQILFVRSYFQFVRRPPQKNRMR